MEVNQSARGHTPLSIACQEGGHLDIVRELLRDDRVRVNQALDIPPEERED